ncbi:MAG: colicin transporter [Parasphingorhabdus sp.]
MKLAAKRLEGIGWLALVFLVAILLYPLSLSVATLRSDLARTDRQIVSVKKEIRYLETEFSARANLRQLEQWNKMEYGYVAPKASQYLEGERALANLGDNNLRKPVKVAVISTMDKVRPAGIIGSVFAKADLKNSNPDGSASTSSNEDAATKPESDRAPTNAELSETRTTRVASLEQKLLDDGVIKDLTRRAERETAEVSAQ